MSGFAFALNDNVRISCSQEAGQVIARAEFVCSENQYLIRYKTAVGAAVEQWWYESAIELNQENGKEVD